MLLSLWLRIGRERLGCSVPIVGAGAGAGLSVRMALVVQEEEHRRRGGAAESVVDVLAPAMIGWEQVSSSGWRAWWVGQRFLLQLLPLVERKAMLSHLRTRIACLEPVLPDLIHHLFALRSSRIRSPEANSPAPRPFCLHLFPQKFQNLCRLFSWVHRSRHRSGIESLASSESH